MKRKIVGILLTGMIIVSLVGCGTRTEATDDELDNETTEHTTETDALEDEFGTEIVMDEDIAEPDAFEGIETDEYVFYSEIARYGEFVPMQDQPFEAENITFVTYEDVPIYNVDGIEVGYVKTGSTINLTESATNISWARFENPVDGTDYDYLYILKDYINESQKIETMLSAKEMKQLIVDEINNRNFDLATILDAPTSDMEVYECRISRENDSTMLNYWIMDAFHNADKFEVGKYMTYYLECEEDEDYIICRLYYKDLYADVVGNN